jgi:curved DNA-binding protein CbpA
MDYYEELGLEPNASPEQIRQAYRELVKLLHPDHHQGRARELAERQMLRLNAILTTLTDPHLRKLYDAQRAGRLAVVPAAESGQRRGRLRATLAAPAGRAWLLAGALGLGGLFWVSRQGAPAAGPLPSAGPTTPAPAAAQAGRPAPAGRRNPESEPRSGARRNSAFQPRASASAGPGCGGSRPRRSRRVSPAGGRGSGGLARAGASRAGSGRDAAGCRPRLSGQGRRRRLR